RKLRPMRGVLAIWLFLLAPFASAGEILLRNDAIEATIRSGMLCSLRQRDSQVELILDKPADQQLGFNPFCEGADVDFAKCHIEQKSDSSSARFEIRAADGSQFELSWAIEPGRGDLILRAHARALKPITQFSFPIASCDIAKHTLVTVSNYGEGLEAKAPWT